MGVPGHLLAIAFFFVHATTSYGGKVPITEPYCPEVRCADGCRVAYSGRPCPECVCPLTCKDIECKYDEKCVLKDVVCVTSPCFPVPDCVPKKEPNDIKACEPGLQCPAEYCEIVFPPGECPRCDCVDCSTVLCMEGTECVMQEVVCKKAPCIRKPVCVPIYATTRKPPCPKIKCLPNCVPDKGPDGCPICACPPTCDTVRCSDGYECQLVNVTCVRAPCFPQPKCVPIYTPRSNKPCPRIRCAAPCVLDRRPYACPKCVCPPTCNGVECSSGYECVLRICDPAPCFPQPICVPIKSQCPQRPTCEIYCWFGFKKDEYGCPLCECLPQRLSR